MAKRLKNESALGLFDPESSRSETRTNVPTRVPIMVYQTYLPNGLMALRYGLSGFNFGEAILPCSKNRYGAESTRCLK